MARAEAASLAALALGLVLSAWAPAADAGTADEPEITDPGEDHVVVGTVPIGPTGQFLNADILAGWIEEDADSLLFNILIAGTGAPGTAGPYTWNFHCTAGQSALEASATTGADGPEPGGAATAAAFADGVVTLTVPRAALAGAAVLTGCHIESQGGTPDEVQDPVSISDLAPDDGEDAGITYEVTGGASGGAPGDSDGDGLNDTREQQQFGGLSENGTGDPDGDGLNNTAEFEAGTNATKADTDGDGAGDREDPFPLDPAQGGSGNGTAGNATADLDRDGLPDGWEREHFNSTSAQDGDNDPDADGLDNAGENEAGTDPTVADTDGDGLNDATDEDPLAAAAEEPGSRVELWSGAAMFAVAATFCLFGLARRV